MANRWGNNADTATIIRSFESAKKLMPRNMYESYGREMRELLRQREEMNKRGRKKR